MIDAHQHFWSYSPSDYAWISPAMPGLRRDFLPADLWAEQAALGFKGSIAVQARQSLEETSWLLGLAARDERIVGVVGWADLCSPGVGEVLRRLAEDPKFRGLRHIVQDEPDDRYLLRPDFMRGLEKLSALKLTYDLLVFPRQLPAAIELVRRFPGTSFVLDHLAKPPIKSGQVQRWADLLAELAAHSNVCCKLSGLVTEADWAAWTPEDLLPYIEAAFKAFGPQRLMFGSDWPVCTLAGSYRQVFQAVSGFLSSRHPGSRDAVLGGNALKVYGCRLPAA